MAQRSQRLPSLNALKVFWAAARHGSFVKAASELHVTPSAVSLQVRQLEDELAPARRADVVLAASDSEVDVIAAAGLKNVYALRHAVTVPAHTPGLSNRQGMVFMGRLLEASSPNVDSVRWFLDECLPIIRARHDAPFTVIGAVTAELAAEFEAKGAIVVGALSDVGPALDAARIMVAPTRFAAGMPIKVPDAVAHGTAVVVTPLLRRQLGWVDGLELAVGDGAEDFARAVLELLDDDSLWTRIHEGGLQRVRAEYSTEALDALVATFLA